MMVIEREKRRKIDSERERRNGSSTQKKEIMRERE